MEKLLIKVSLDSDCDPELLKHIIRIPKRRRAEQMRKLALKGLLNPYKNDHDVIEPSTSSNQKAISASSDDKLLEEDIGTLNIK